MIFTESANTSINHEAVQESSYDLGIGGALGHVYENECNFNALMKAAALSEAKFYAETGGDLFVQEAGAFSSFVEKAKAFFKKVIEKIKSIAKKFMMRINQFDMKDKDFIKKYQKDLLTRDLKDFEFDGYAFPAWTGNTNSSGIVAGLKADGTDDADAINDIVEKNRGGIVGGAAMTEAEYRSELKEKLYGDKDTIKVQISAELGIISETSKLTKAAEKEEKDTIKAIEDMIKAMEKSATEIGKGIKYDNTDKTENERRSGTINCLNNKISVYKSFSNDLTVYFGAVTKALADRNRQAKAICVKAMSYKHESAGVAESGSYGDIFAGVSII